MKDVGNIFPKFKFKFLILGIIAIITLLVGFNNCYVVQTGEVAIISTFGKVDKVEGEGLHFKIPFIQSKYFMETREQTYAFTNENGRVLEVSTKDMQSILVEITVQVSVSDPEKLYKSFKGLQYERFIAPRTKEIIQATISKYTIEEFISKRTEISKIIFEDLKDDFSIYGLNVSNVSIINHDFSDEYERAVEMKKVAEQAVETAKAEQEKLTVEAENKVKLAEYRLQEKELQAKANAVESNSLTPQLLRKMAIEKWDGKLPQVQGSGTNTFINLEQ